MSCVLISIYLIFYLILALKRLDWAVMLILAALPGYLIRFHAFGLPITLLEAMILIAFAVFFFSNIKRILKNVRTSKLREYFKRKNRYPFDVEIVTVLLISWVAIIAAGVTNDALGIWKAYFFEPALVFILVLNVFKYSANDANGMRMTRIANHANGTSNKHGVEMTGINIERILWPLTVSAFMVAVIAIIEMLTGWFSVEAFWPRVTGPFPYPNALGLYLGPLVLVMAGWALKQFSIFQPKADRPLAGNFQTIKILFVIFTTGLSLAAIFLAKSEGALIGVAAGFFVIAVFWMAGKINMAKWLPKALIFFIFSIVIFSSVIYIKIIPEHKYFNFENKGLNYITDKAMLKDLSGEIRKQQWRETWAMMRDDWRWLIGAGLSNYQAAVRPYHQEGIFFNKDHDPDFRRKIVHFDERYKAERWQPVEIYMYPHNLFLNFWVELGLMGVLLFVWIIFKFIYTIITNYQPKADQPLADKLQITNSGQEHFNKYLSLGLLGAIIVIITHGIVDVPYFKNDLAVMFWVFLAMVGVLNLEIKSKKLKNQ